MGQQSGSTLGRQDQVARLDPEDGPFDDDLLRLGVPFVVGFGGALE